MSGQHVGKLSDSVGGEEPAHAGLARSMARLARPQKARGGHATGNGDLCPIDPEHGKMLVAKNYQSQYCPDQSHDGAWSAAGKLAQSRQFWPVEGFAYAVAAYHEIVGRAELPDLDIGELNA